MDFLNVEMLEVGCWLWVVSGWGKEKCGKSGWRGEINRKGTRLRAQASDCVPDGRWPVRELLPKSHFAGAITLGKKAGALGWFSALGSATKSRFLIG